MTTYTNNTYGRQSVISIQQNVFNLLKQLFKAKPVGEEGLRYLVAWGVFKTLLKYTLPRLILSSHHPGEVCYKHVEKAMPFAIKSVYFQTGAFIISLFFL